MVADAAADVAMNLRRVNVFLFTSVFSLSCVSCGSQRGRMRVQRRTALAESAALERQPAPALRREQ